MQKFVTAILFASSINSLIPPSVSTLLLPIVQFQKIFILSHRRDWNFLGGGGSGRPKNLKKCMKLNWNFQMGGEVLQKNPFFGGGMDIFWNYTL